jgi:ketosteroid isomerase-like protein
MNFGRILTCALTVAMATAAQAKYDRALDGKTKIWHNPPEPNLQASWSGERDEKGYATGRGTLTWFRIEHRWETGSLLPGTKYIQVSQYEGKMVDGRLEGSVVRTDSIGTIRRAKFADGRKTTDWTAGSASTAAKHADQQVSKHSEPEAPAEGPAPTPKLDEHVPETPAAATVTTAATTPPPPATPPAIAQQATKPASSPSSDSLRSLAMPPSSLRIASLNESSKQPAAPSPETEDETAPAEASSEAQASTSTSPASSAPASLKGEDAQTVAALDTEYHAAVKTNDATTIDRILADDFVLMHGAGLKLSKADIVKRAREKQSRYEHQEVQSGSQNVRVWRDTAVVTETLWVKGAEQGKPVDEKFAVTETYVRTPDGWRYVSGQAVPAAK